MPPKPQKPKSTKKSKPTSTPKTTPVPVVVEAAPAPVSEPAPVPEPVYSEASVSVASTEPQITLESQFNDLNSKLAALKTLEAEIVGDLRRLQKTVTRHLKEVTKKNKRRTKVDPEDKQKRAPSGFAKPTIISDELCEFLGKDHGSEMARTEVTKELTKYIKQYNLQDEKDRRKILPDPKLKKLLNIQDGQEVTYFNLQKYMKVHFPKAPAPTLVV